MKTMKRALALVLSVVMMLTLCVTAMADESNGYTITVNNETAGYTYTAYQVFDASVDSEGKLGDIKWGSAVNGETILEKLQADNAFNTTTGEGDAAVTKNDFADCKTAADVADVLKNYTDNSAKLVAFADVVGHNLKTDATGAAFTYNAAVDGTEANYSTHVNDGGYYLVVNSATTDKTESGSTASLSRYLLKVVADAKLEPKTETPEIDKNIVNNNDANVPMDADQNGKGKNDTAAIGDVIQYQIDGKVPDYTGYTYYYYVINDTLSTGLTLNDDYEAGNAEKTGGFKVTVGGTELTRDTDYFVYKNVTEGEGENAKTYTFQIAFNNIKDYRIGDAIVITYSATVNENAVIGTNPNTNKVTLTYSNNPNDSSRKDKDGEPGKPDSTVPKGTTPEKTTNTYVTELQLTKVDQDGYALAGAEFTLTGKNLNKVKITTGSSYVEDANGTYWKLKDGTYTTDDPATEGMDTSKYQSMTVKYKVETVVTSVKETTSENSKVTAYVDENGKLTFTGLNAGEYTLSETKTPAGYNTAADITFTIDANLQGGDNEDTFTWTINDGSSVTYKDGVFKVTVENKKGSTLPSTGGMGTTIFYVVGTVMVLGAGVVLIARKRMKNQSF